MPSQIPVAVEVCRGGRVESRHRASAVVSDAVGKTVLEIGDVDQPVFPRSSIKMFQALPLIETGAADALGLGPAELAVACASHGGETFHVELVKGWLARMGLSPDNLGCGPHPPSNKAAADALTAAGIEPGRIHNNCSGKHTGMLAVARHMGEPIEAYLAPDHPVQRRVFAILQDFTGGGMIDDPGIDGCGVPSWPVSLRGLALAAARFAQAHTGNAARDRAIRRLQAAMRQHPELVAGTGRCCTAVMRTLDDVVVKTGAEGVFLGALPSRGLGIALKVEDGATRASNLLIIALLERLGAVSDGHRQALAKFRDPVLKNFAGREVGVIRLAESWLDD